MGTTLPSATEALQNAKDWWSRQTISFPSWDQLTRAPHKDALRLAPGSEQQTQALKAEAQSHPTAEGLSEPRCIGELPKKKPDSPTKLVYSNTEKDGICYATFHTPRGPAQIGAPTIGYVSRNRILAFESWDDQLRRQLEAIKRTPQGEFFKMIELPRYNSEMVIFHSYSERISIPNAAQILERGAWATQSSN